MTSAALDTPHRDLLVFLRDPANYSERPEQIEVIETHISWLFLTRRFVYKLKKPVRYSFVEFMTVDARHQACLDEVRLNRRLALDVYLNVKPLSIGPTGQIVWGDGGRIVDWVVKMRRLSDRACLTNGLKTGEIPLRVVDRLADFLAHFFAQLPPLTMRPEEAREQLTELIESNEHDLCECFPDQSDRVRRIHGAQRRFVATHTALFDSRVCDGRYVEGHGDLRPEHIYLLPNPVVIDCIEFSRRLRCIDILDELAFFAMECDHVGRPDVGQRVVSRYRAMTGDRASVALWSFYKSYRASVRAKVTALAGNPAWSPRPDATSHASGSDRAAEYLRQAASYQDQFGRPVLVIVSGLMGSGKSTLSEALANRLGASLLQTDQLRLELHGRNSEPLRFGQGRYGQAWRDAVYREMFGRCGERLRDGGSVVMDGTFSAQWQRCEAQALANQHQADLVLVYCHCPREVAIRRIEQRRQGNHVSSEARGELFDELAHRWEPIPPSLSPLVVDTREPLDRQIQSVLDCCTRSVCD